MRILIAEDDRVFTKMLQNSLDALGHEWVAVPDGNAAWAAIQAEHFPIVISDWVMPGIEGPDLCRRIRALPDRSYCYVVILTSKDRRNDRIDALDAGADDYLAKPLDTEELRARLAVATRILDMQSRLEEQNRELESASAVAEFARNRFSHLFEGLPIACFTYDHEGTVFEWNRRAEEVFGFPPHDALGRPISDLVGPELVGEHGRGMLQQVFDGHAFQSQEWSDGKRSFLASGLPLRGPDGKITGGILSAVDVTRQKEAEAQIGRQLVELEAAHAEMEKLNQRLAALAVTDALTGIPNHRAFQDRLHLLVKEASRGRRFALVMIDVDKFKLFNDEFGHQAGDEVLRSVGKTLGACIRCTDFAARYGGEEFCVLFTDVDEPTALMLAERLRQSVEATECPYRRITASFGVCAWSAGIGAEGLIKAADEALYAAKAAGRNRVVSASGMGTRRL